MLNGKNLDVNFNYFHLHFEWIMLLARIIHSATAMLDKILLQICCAVGGRRFLLNL